MCISTTVSTVYITLYMCICVCAVSNDGLQYTHIYIYIFTTMHVYIGTRKHRIYEIIQNFPQEQ